MSARRFSATMVVLAAFLSTAAASRGVEYRLLPPNTEIVVTINVKQILASELVKSQTDLIKQVKDFAEAKIPGGLDEGLKYFEKMGFDPMRDLISVTIAHPGSASGKDVFVILEGNYNKAKFDATAKEVAENFGNVLKITKVGMATVYEVRPEGDTVVYVSLLGKALVVTLNEEAMKGAVNRSTGTMIAATKVKDLLKSTNDKQSFNFVMTGKALVNMVDLGKEKVKQAKKLDVGEFLNEVSGVTGAVTIGKDLDIMLGVGFKKADTAKEIAALGMGGIGLLKPVVEKQVEKMPQLAPLVDFIETIRVSENANTVSITGSFANANLKKLLKSLGDTLK